MTEGLELIEKLICEDVSQETTSPISPLKLAERIAREHGLTMAHIVGHSTRSQYVAARKEIIFRLDREGMSAAAIGRLMKKDHTTILHHLKSVNHGGNTDNAKTTGRKGLAQCVYSNNPPTTHVLEHKE